MLCSLPSSTAGFLGIWIKEVLASEQDFRDRLEEGNMLRLRLLLGLCAVLALGVWVAPAAADPGSVPICPSAGTALSGSHGNLTITGDAYVAGTATLTVRGNLTLAPGSCLDAFSLGTVTVGGNILVHKGATLGLGCTGNSIGPGPPCNGMTTDDTVGGNITGNQPLTMYLDGDTVDGNVVSNGGGPGLGLPFLNFPVKDNAIGGNLIVQGWHGGWAGAIRNVVGGNLIFSRNVSMLDPDAMEVVTNAISGNLICMRNRPAVQVGDSGGSPNTVAGKKIGQCTAPGL
jgi:hypothetical protein